MENKIKAGDVWWNTKDGYGKMFIQVESSMSDLLRCYLIHDESVKSITMSWETGGLTKPYEIPSTDWVMLYNIHEVTSISLKALNEEYRTRP